MADPVVLVVDFGAQYAQLIARRVREARVYSEIVPHTITAAEVAERNPAALILSGGPASVRIDNAPLLDKQIYDLNIPTLGICYGAQLLARDLGGAVGRFEQGEYGRTTLQAEGPSALLGPDASGESVVWMSHFDAITKPPTGAVTTAWTASAPAAVFEDRSRRVYGVQFHPEVVHSDGGQALLERFLLEEANIEPTWTMDSIVEGLLDSLRSQIGSGRAICGLSGGVDSAVAAALVHRAIGDRLTCVYVDTGLMRKNESEQVVETFERNYGIDLIKVDAGDRFFDALAGVSEPEAKRSIIGELFIRVFEEAEKALDDADYLVQGTLYSDVVESGTGDTTATIKSHHNVGGLPEEVDFELVEPLRNLFKDEVRRLGTELGLPDEIVWRQPFPGPGLGVRIIGEVTPQKVEVLQNADAIVREEINNAGLQRAVFQSFAVLPDIKTVGVMGDERTYAYPIIVRSVDSDDVMTADWSRLPFELLERMSSRIINEVDGVNRVAYDITSKPPGTIEWE